MVERYSSHSREEKLQSQITSHIYITNVFYKLKYARKKIQRIYKQPHPEKITRPGNIFNNHGRSVFVVEILFGLMCNQAHGRQNIEVKDQ